MAHMGGPTVMPNGGMTVANAEIERHIRQNNQRLQCIQKHLQTPEGFEKAAKELLEWCSDPRAFQKAFETSLMNCLNVISEVAPKPGFNLHLGYRLVAVCSANREKFSPKSSNMLHFWSEELGKLLLLQNQKKKTNEVMKHPCDPPGFHMGMNYQSGPPMGPRYPDSPVWGQGNVGPNPGPMPRPQHPSVSVITTVWGVTNTTQTPPLRGQSHPPVSQQYSQHMGPGSASHPRPHSQPQGYHMDNYGHSKSSSYGGPGHYQRQESFGPSMSGRNMHAPGYGPNPGSHQGHHMGADGNEYAPPAAAAAAAAVAAAAATATATATATLIANDQQQQNEMYDQMSQHRGNGMHSMDSGPMHPHGGGMNQPGLMRGDHSGMVAPGGRAPPRQNLPPQYAQQGRSMGPSPHPMNPSHHPSNSPVGVPPHNSPGYNGMGQQYRQPFRSASRPYGSGGYDSLPPHQFKSPPLNTGHPHTPSAGFSPRVPTPSSQVPTPLLTATPDLYPSVSSAGSNSPYFPNVHQPNSGPHPSPGPVGYPPQRHPSYQSQYGAMFRGGPHHTQPNPMPGNPTPPLTPGSAHNVPPYPGPDIKPPLSLDVKSIIPTPNGLPPMEDPMAVNPPINNDEMRMTFPVRDGIVLESFRLEHNRSVSTHAFHLRPPAHQTLTWRPDLELQFKCYHHDDKMQYTNWPHSVQVTVNGQKMAIPRHPVCKPLYLRNVVQPGRNSIEISVSTCCCSHLFVLQLVHRPSVRSVLMGLLQKRMLPAANCVTKIKRYFMNGVHNSKNMIGSPMGNGMNPGDGDGNSVVVSLRCPITCRRINLPARGSECKHIQCFDLESYLQLNSDKRTWMCPICKKSALLEGLEVDQYIWGILKESHPDDLEVTIDQRCVWKPVSVKREITYNPEEQDGPPCKRIRSNGMSPESMFNHLPSPGSYVPQMTPLPPNRLTMTPDMNSSGPGGFHQNSGGCGFPGGSNGYQGGPCMPGTHNGMVGNLGISSSPSTMAGPMTGTLHRANPLQLENIAADDMVTIEKRLNHAMANTISPNRAINHAPSTPAPNLNRINIKTEPQPCGNLSQPRTPSSDPRVRTSMEVPPSLTSGSHGNPNTPGLGLSPSVTGSHQGNANVNNMSGNMTPSTPGNGMTSSSMAGNDLNFDPAAVINGAGLNENIDKIPTLDILPENTEALDLISFLGPDTGGSADDDDIFSYMFNEN